MKRWSVLGLVLACVVLTGFVVPSPTRALSWVPASKDAPAATVGWLCWNDGSIDPCRDNLRAAAALSAADAWMVGDALLHWNGTAWQRVANPATSTLNAVSMITSDDVWAAGDAGTILHWNGTTWGVVDSKTSSDLYSVSMVAANDGWAVGDGGTVLRWDGSAWTPLTGLVTSPLHGVAMVSASDGWAVGDGIILHWDGNHWLGEGSPTTGALYSVAQVSASDVWAVGAGGVILHWDGESWTEVDGPIVSDLTSVAMAAENAGWAVGGNGVILNWNGSAWTQDSSPVGSTGRLNGVAVTSATNGWAVGDGGAVVRWDGTTWKLASSPAVDWLYAMSMVSATDGWAVGEAGTIRRWNGTGWDDAASHTTSLLNGVSAVSSNDAWAVGDAGVILRWNGSMWEGSNPTNNMLFGVSMISETDGFAVGELGTILHWNGTVWSRVDSHTTSLLWGVKLRTADDGWAVGDGGTILHWDGSVWSVATSGTTDVLYAVTALSATDAWAVGGSGTILHWNGSIWSTVPGGRSIPLYAVAGTGTNDVWAMGDDGAILHWDGSAWTLSTAATKEPLYGIALLPPDQGWAVGGGGVVLTLFLVPTFTSPAGANFTAGTFGSFTVSAAGNPVPALALPDGTLPAGVSFVDKGNGTATLSGTATAGVYHFTISATNPGASVVQDFTLTVNNPAPSLSSLNPSSVVVNHAAFTLQVNGTGFLNSALVSWDGSSRTTTFASANQLTAEITAADLAVVGPHSITVVNPAPTAGPSNALTFVVSQAPAITSATGTTFMVGASGLFTVTTTGYPVPAISESGTLPSGVTFKDNSDGTASLSGTPASSTAGPYPLAFTADNGVGSPATQSFNLTVNNTAPAVSAISPTSVVINHAAFTLVVTGTGFVDSSVVRWNGSDLATTFVSPTQVTASVPAANVETAGSQAISVSNPAPGGGTATGITFMVTTGNTQVALAAAPNPSIFGNPVVITATVTQVVNQPEAVPTGTVTLRSGGVDITGCVNMTLDASQQAVCTTSALTVGTHALSAAYGGDSNFGAAVSPDLSQVVNDVAIAGLAAANDSPTRLHRTTTFTATVTAGSNITYTWDFGDGSPTVTGKVVTHTYAHYGSFTATVTTANTANSKTATTPVNVWRAVYLPVIKK
jgi:photosystem II stability/assembly factor-like uncharacterized protein